jgi:predicted O-methyltransferase YrrM
MRYMKTFPNLVHLLDLIKRGCFIRAVGKDTFISQYKTRQKINEFYLLNNSISSNEFLNKRGWSKVEIKESFKHEFSKAEGRLSNAAFELGGAANLDLLVSVTSALMPKHVLETGVAHGWSSFAILTVTKDAILTSIDLPYLAYNNEKEVGLAVNPGDKNRWKLLRGPDKYYLKKMPKQHFCFAHYDSDKSFDGMRSSLLAICKLIKPGGLIVVDDIGDTEAYLVVCDILGLEPIIIRDGEGKKFQGIIDIGH